MRRSVALSWSIGFVFASVFASAGLVRAAVTCVDDSVSYETTCVGKAAGTPCINVSQPLSPVGCCNKGTCNGSGSCDLTNPGGPNDDFNCNDNNACTSDQCIANISTYQASCPHAPTAPGSACTDGNACTTDACNGSGTCVSTNANAGTACTADANVCTNDACDGNGTCVATNAAAGTSCGNIDSDVCTRDQCNGSGTCVANFGGTDDCSSLPPPNNQCRQYTCNAVNGCVAGDKPDGTTCNDGKDCTRGDNCQNGQCGRGAGNGSLASNGTICRNDNTNNPANRTWCNVGTCNGTEEGCKNTHELAAQASCDDNPCTTATCQTKGGQCLVTSCAPATTLCPNCNNSQCNPGGTTGDANGLIMCGCLSVLQ